MRGGPLLWVTVPEGRPDGRARRRRPRPPVESEEWTDVGYVMAKAESDIARTAYLADALPIHNPWLGPDQFSAWLGADITFKPRDNTSWVKPFIEDWDAFGEPRLDAANRWWRLYLEILRESVRRGRDRWVTCYPDLHTGIDGLAAMRGPERLMFDLLEQPEAVERAMRSMTRLWKEIVDTVSSIVLPAGQGTTNWTAGWSARRFVCLGQNDFSCLVGPGMFDRFILPDTVACCRHVDRIIYHLDGPGALQHLDRLLAIDALHCVQWIQGAGAPLPSRVARPAAAHPGRRARPCSSSTAAPTAATPISGPRSTPCAARSIPTGCSSWPRSSRWRRRSSSCATRARSPGRADPRPAHVQRITIRPATAAASPADLSPVQALVEEQEREQRREEEARLRDRDDQREVAGLQRGQDEVVARQHERSRDDRHEREARRGDERLAANGEHDGAERRDQHVPVRMRCSTEAPAPSAALFMMLSAAMAKAVITLRPSPRRSAPRERPPR